MATKMKFYDAKFKDYIFVHIHSVWKVKTITKGGRARYVFKTETVDGRKLTRVTSERDWNIAGCAER